jgi:hypothetical protein
MIFKRKKKNVMFEELMACEKKVVSNKIVLFFPKLENINIDIKADKPIV